MTLNASDAFSQALELFSSLFQDMFASDLPAGLSPDNADVWFLPGKVQTRPALQKDSAIPPDASSVMSLAEFALPTGDYFAMRLYSSGNLWQQDSETLAFTKIGAVTPGCQFRSISAFDKQWFAFFNQSLSAAFTDSPFSGADVPRYFDGMNLWRVTQDAPGIAPIFSSVPTLPLPLLQSTPTGTVSITAAVSSGAQQIQTYPPGTYITIYTSILYTCTAPVSGTWLGSRVTVTGCTGTNSSLVNVTGTITAVSGSTFTLGVYTGQTFVNLSSQTGTGTLAGNYFGRAGNIVTVYANGAPSQFFPGLYAQILNSNGSQINGTNWTIDATGGIKRDATGLVTITIDTQLTNLASGTVLYINASDTADFPAGLQTVYQVLSSTGGKTTFTVSNPTWGNGAIVTSNTGGTVYQQWSGVFQILTVGVDANSNNFFTYFQLGPDATLNTTGGTPQAQVQSQVAPGPRSAVLMFKSANGAITAPSIPIQLSLVGGTNLLSASQIAIGPPGTSQRIIAFTPAYGSSWFYITPAFIPSVSGLSPMLSLGTIINDNTTTAIVLDFSDAQLTAGTAIDQQGNNLFAQVVLAPCLGFIEYEGRLGVWGEINNVKNLINAGFGGGYIAPTGTVNTAGTTVTLVSGSAFWNTNPTMNGSTIIISGVSYIIQNVVSASSITLATSAGTQTGVPFTILFSPGQVPPGWDTGGSTYTALGNLIFGSAPDLGFSYQMGGNGGLRDSLIEQSGFHDVNGAPILLPNTQYVFSCRIAASGGTVGGNLVCEFYSASVGSIATTAFTMPATVGWAAGALSARTPSVIPVDTKVRIYLAGVPLGAFATINEVSIINGDQPVLFQQMRLSYFNNPFGFDQNTGTLGIASSAKITAAFKQRGYLYALTDGPLYQTQNNGQSEPFNWNFSPFADECDCFGPNAVTTTEDIAWWAGQSGFRVFDGSKPKKLSQEIQPTWETINLASPTAVWAVSDPEQRLVYIGIPVNGATIANQVLPMSYRSVDAAYNVPDPLHTSYSGKLIATDLCRKWTIWNMPMICGALLTRPGLQRQMFFGGPAGSFSGNIYSMNFVKYSDDDFGQIFSYYTTYFFFNHDIESQAPGLGLHLKIYTYLTAYITGIGQIQPTALINNLGNTWAPLATVWDPVNLVWTTGASSGLPAQTLTNGVLLNDLEWALNINGAARLAIKWSALPLAGQTDAAFQLTHMVLSSREAQIAVRGAQ